MSSTILRARIALAFFLAAVISALAILVLAGAEKLPSHALELLATLIGSLTTVMVFSVHAIFTKNAEAEAPPVPTMPPQAANQPGAKNA